jgi:hypothetical protein
MNTKYVLDAAFPDDIGPIPNEVSLMAVYCGGAAKNIWTLDQTRRYHLYRKVPIYVCRPDHTGKYAGFELLMAAYEFGVPQNTPWMLDTELRQSNADGYYTDLIKVVRYYNYWLWKYASDSWIKNLPSMDGDWYVDPTQEPHFTDQPGERACQYYWGQYDHSVKNYDLSVMHSHGASMFSAEWTNAS